MRKEIIIDNNRENTIAALLEDGQLMEVYVEYEKNHSSIGYIYKGVVENILPGMQAAFVDIGLEKNGFLYVDDALPKVKIEEGETLPPRAIEDVLHKGQELMVQIVKEQVGTKGARLTTNITLPGRYVVLMPTVHYIGISRRIEEEEERERLHQLAEEVVPPGMGLIIRTVAAYIGKEELQNDIKRLQQQWKRILGKVAKAGAPSLIHQDLGLVARLVRDILVPDIDALYASNTETLEKIKEVVAEHLPELQDKVRLKPGENLLLQSDFANQLAKALKRKVWLKCGGYLVIDQMEALTVIDVNTGKYVGENNLADTVLQTNLDAVEEIARQLRLRNIGGIVIVDFIDMLASEDQEKVLAALAEALKRDRVKTNILGLTQLGLLEMTRKKNGRQLTDILQRQCPMCDGRGKVGAEEMIALEAKKQIRQLAQETTAPALYCEVNQAVAACLIGPSGSNLHALEGEIRKKVLVKGCPGMKVETILVRPEYTPAEMSHGVAPVTVGQELSLLVEDFHAEDARDGVARLAGFVICIHGGGAHLGSLVHVRIAKVAPTYATAEIIY